MQESKVWREHVGFVAWPTLAVFAGVITTYGLASWAGWTGRIPLAVALVINTLAAYASFTPVHEAAHGNVFGAKHQRAEGIVGWIAAAFLFKPFSLFRKMHLQHHTHTNDPAQDPDH